MQVLHRDDGSSKNITLIDKKNIHNNRLQVINQYEVKRADGARHDNRYDVTILVNGFPLVHVELEAARVAIREAFNQINRYQRDSFWAGCGLYEYAQIFVISNGTNTKYYSNSTRYNAIKDAKHGKTKKEKTSNSFEFTSYWADANNRVLTDLIDFTRTFFAKHTILSVLTRYCIFTSEKDADGDAPISDHGNREDIEPHRDRQQLQKSMAALRAVATSGTPLDPARR